MVNKTPIPKPKGFSEKISQKKPAGMEEKRAKFSFGSSKMVIKI